MGQRERRHYIDPPGLPVRVGRTIISRYPKKSCNVLASRPLRRKDQDCGSTLGIKHDVRMSGIWPAMNLQGIRRRFEPALRRIFHLYWRFARGMTLGVRAVVLDGENRVFLVKHSYVSGWHLPGGGVEVGETFGDALKRELMEEGRVEVLGQPILHGLFLNSHVSRRDHVAVYVVRQFRQDRLPEPNREIVACGFFDAAALPAGTTRGTRLRISEVLEGRAPIATWRDG
jgi:ADP-ribose pyrophosphatase YjhB (NUDIX family)